MGQIKLHIGCGKRDFGTDWHHIDGANYPHVKWNKVNKLPYADSVADIIYSSHLIAYFDRIEVLQLLKEWHRILKPDGLLRLATPDWDVLREMRTPLIGPLYGRMEMKPDVWIYHKTVWNAIDLCATLRDCGFENFRRYDHNTTEHARFDDHSAAYHNRQLISLNLECNARK